MADLKAFLGRVLFVDLSSGRSLTIETSQEDLARYPGGRGAGIRLLTEEGGHQIPPLSPDAPLIVAAGPLTSTKAPGAGRVSMSAVSPLTGTVFDSNSGGFFGHRLKGAGFDALVVTGRAETLSVLAVDPSGVRILPSPELKGLGNSATRRALAASLGPGYLPLTVGPAGEAGSLIANVCHNGRFFGRGGLGAIFGAKNLKAIAVAGDYRPELSDPARFDFIVHESRKLLSAHPITSKGLRQFGTAVMMNLLNAMQVLPTGNFRGATFGGAEKISGEAMKNGLLTGTHACPGCPVACGRRIELDGVEAEGPEFETLWAFGAALEIDDLPAIARLNLLANDLGLDTVSAGSTIAAARELFERGLLDFDPLAGGAEGLADLLGQMAGKTGAGTALSDGSARLASAVGGADASMSVKGMELPAYDPRGCQGQGLAYATSNRGGCHMRSYMVAPEILASPKLVDRFATSGKAGLVIVGQNLNAAVDSLVMCRFMSFALKDDYYARLLRAATGLDVDAQAFMTIGERIYNLERLANLSLGFGRESDTLPSRLLNEPVGEGPAAGRPVDLNTMLGEYYRFRGWDEEGRPTLGKLKSLGLEPVDRT